MRTLRVKPSYHLHLPHQPIPIHIQLVSHHHPSHRMYLLPLKVVVVVVV